MDTKTSCVTGEIQSYACCHGVLSGLAYLKQVCEQRIFSINAIKSPKRFGRSCCVLAGSAQGLSSGLWDTSTNNSSDIITGLNVNDEPGNLYLFSWPFINSLCLKRYHGGHMLIKQKILDSYSLWFLIMVSWDLMLLQAVILQSVQKTSK